MGLDAPALADTAGGRGIKRHRESGPRVSSPQQLPSIRSHLSHCWPHRDTDFENSLQQCEKWHLAMLASMRSSPFLPFSPSPLLPFSPSPFLLCSSAPPLLRSSAPLPGNTGRASLSLSGSLSVSMARVESPFDSDSKSDTESEGSKSPFALLPHSDMDAGGARMTCTTR